MRYNNIHLFPLQKGDMKICSPEKSHISRGQCPREIWLFRGWTNFHISLMQGKWMLYSTRPTFWWILPNEIFWPSLFTKLLFRNISGVIFTSMEYRYMTKALNLAEFRIREIRYCWEGNTMLLRGKYDVLINVSWDCFDQSNFYISRINIIEWNNIRSTSRWHLNLLWCLHEFRYNRWSSFQQMISSIRLCKVHITSIIHGLRAEPWSCIKYKDSTDKNNEMYTSCHS